MIDKLDADTIGLGNCKMGHRGASVNTIDFPAPASYICRPDINLNNRSRPTLAIPKTFQIPVVSGGKLITSFSANMVSPADYVRKLNFRRDKDQEIRREGWVKFNPLAGPASEYIYDAALTCNQIVELIRGDGSKAILGFSRSAVKLFDNTAGTWSTIGSGYSASGKRWQVVLLNGTVIINNAVDLPAYWNIGDTAVTPMYELREVGVACVGRIVENNGFLIILDITEIRAAQLDHWMNGYAAYPSSGTIAKAASFTALVAETTKTYQVTTGAVDMVATLPTVAIAGYAVALYYLIEKVDAGVGVITTSPSVEDYPIELDTVGDLALVWWDIVRGKWAAVKFPAGSVPATDPYGLVPAAIDITERLPWAVANGEYGDGTRWAPVFSVYMAAASATITLPFASSVFVGGQTRVAVVNGGPLGGTLGGQEDTPDGVMVLSVAGAVLTLQESTDVDLTYPRVVQILRWTDISSLVGRYLLQGDNSAITTAVTLRDWLVIFRETGIYMGRYTGDPNAPFVFTPKYAGSNVPLWPDAVANVRSDYLLYPAKGNRMYRFDGVTWPELHDVTDNASTLFFNGYDQADEVFAVENPITKEIWFCLPDKTMAFDFDTPGGSVSEINQAFTAAAVVHKTGTTDVWFIMAIGRFIYTNGLVYGITPIQTWLRDGSAVDSILKFGLASFGDQSNEKLLLNLTPVLASTSPDVELELQIYGTHNPSAAPVALLSPVASLPTPAGNNFVTLAFQTIYVQDEITLVETADVDARYSLRIWEVELVKAGGVTRSIA